MSHFSDVNDFHTRFRLEVGTYPHLLNDEELNLRVEMFHEEIIEFTRAHRKGDLVAAFDALLDLAYFVIGTAVKMCLPWNRGWMAVHFANMRKARVPSGETSKVRGGRTGFDVVKPEGWEGPESSLNRLLNVRRQEVLDDAHDNSRGS